jgi:anti-sigma factor RsiW
MDCKEACELLPAQVDKELGVSESMALERHLEACPECRARFAEQVALAAAMRKHATYFAAPEGLASRIQAALPRNNARRPAPPARPRVWAWGWWNAGVGIAFAALVASNVVLYRALPSANEQLADAALASHVRSLMGNHATDVVSSDQHTVKPWFDGKLDFSPPVVDLAAQGFPLTGGRLDYLDNRPVAALVYRHRLHVINLYVWPAADGRDSAVQSVSRQGYTLMHWQRGGMMFWAVSDLAVPELQEFARLVFDASTKAASLS